MLELLWLVPTIPIISFVVLAFWGKRLGRSIAALFGVGSVGLSAACAIIVAIGYFSLPEGGAAFSQTLWQWLSVGNLQAGLTLHLDPLSLLMILVVTVVGFLIHLYSASFMADDDGYSRFFAYMNLFVGFMLILVLADNLLFLMIGWEGVGLCSYLLIGFWYSDPANGAAARKAFIVTRIGDVALILGLFIFFNQFGSLNIQAILTSAQNAWPVGAAIAGWAALCILGGAIGKSAQLPLQTWLPDAMAGPTPTSALIHAATMVTAGVYLITRMHVIFELAPVINVIVAVIGAATLLVAGLAALGQRDIKRVLAYSTISQIGYMFLAMGVGAYSAAMFHFMTHAFFKALLFLGAGVVILAMHHEHDMFKMGGLKKYLPVTFWTFLAGCGALSAVPLITSGFYSKDAILWASWASPQGSPVLWLAGIIGALLTSLYTFRMFYLTFYGNANTETSYKSGVTLRIPLIVLAVLAVVSGWIDMPDTLGGFQPFSKFLGSVLPSPDLHASSGSELIFQIIAAIVSVGGIYIAYILYRKRRDRVKESESYPLPQPLYQYFYRGLGFDWLYDHLIVIPYRWIAHVNRTDFIDRIVTGIAWLNLFLSHLFSFTQNGKLRSYAYAISLGAVVIIIAILII